MMAKILIVDDSIVMNNIIFDFLNKLGHDVIGKESVISGLKAFEQYNHDMVILDMITPIIDGLEFITQLRKMPQGLYTPIIVASTYISIKQVMDILDTGATYFLNKPISCDKLNDYVERILILIKKNQLG